MNQDNSFNNSGNSIKVELRDRLDLGREPTSQPFPSKIVQMGLDQMKILYESGFFKGMKLCKLNANGIEALSGGSSQTVMNLEK